MNSKPLFSGEILVVDDSSAMRVLLRKILENAFKGWTVRAMASGQDALQERDALARVSLVITDMEMPGMDGEVFLKNLQEDPLFHEKPVILLSGGGFHGLEEVYGSSKTIKFLQKPCRPQVLIDAAGLLLAEGGFS